MRHTRQEARAQQQAREHEAERLRIEIVTLREALEEETAARASLEGQLRVQREETGEGRGGEPPQPCPPRGTDHPPGEHPGTRRGERGDSVRTSLDLSFLLFHTEVLEGEYGPEPGRVGRAEGGCEPDVWPLPDFPASLCSLRTEMERIQQEQSKVRLDSRARLHDGGRGGSVETPAGLSCPFCRL